MDTRTMTSALAMASGLAGLSGSRPMFEGDAGGGGGEGGGAEGAEGAGGAAAGGGEGGGSGSMLGSGAGGAAGGATPPASGSSPGGQAGGEGGFARPAKGFGNFLDDMSDEQLASVPREFFGSAHLEGLTDLPTAVKVLHDRGAALSKKPLRMPTRSDPPEAWDAFYKDLGRPEKPDGYAIARGEGSAIPEGFELPKEDLATIQGVLHKAGLSEQQGSAVLTAYAEQLAEAQTGISAQLEQRNREARAMLAKEWGEDVQANLDELTDFVKQREGGDELLAELNENGLGMSPRLLTFMHDLVKKSGALADAGLAMTTPGGHRLSVGDMEREMTELTTNPETAAALRDKSHPRHNELSKRLDALAEALGKHDDAIAKSGAR